MFAKIWDTITLFFIEAGIRTLILSVALILNRYHRFFNYFFSAIVVVKQAASSPIFSN